MSVAFELRSQHKKSFDGGSVALPNGKTFDIGKELKKGKGRIVTDDPVLVDRLERIEVLKPVTASKSSGGGKSAGGQSSETEKGAES